MCPKCHDVTFEQLVDWLLKNQTQSEQGRAERLLKAFTLTKKET